jgi:hypothetical protein
MVERRKVKDMNQFRLYLLYLCIYIMSQGNSLCSYIKQTKTSFLFPFTKLENRRVEQVSPGVGDTCERGEEVEK